MNNIIYLKIPEVCPICGEPTKIIVSDSGVKTLVCPNSNCQGKIINILDHFCSKKGLDIKGLSKSTLEKLINWGFLNNILDIFTLKEYRLDWIRKDGFGPKSVDNILAAIEMSKKTTLDKFITSFGIPLIGSSVSKEISTKINSYAEFRALIDLKFDFTSWGGFGYEMNNALHNFDYSLMDEVAKLLTISNPNNIIAERQTMSGIIFCVTGKLNIFTNRNELIAEIEKFGGKVTSSVSKNTKFLINNDSTSASSKNVSAQRLGIPILTEEEFINKFLPVDFLKKI